ncbi:DNA polymerase III subunit [Alienimonas californiensis]|uniref:DNA polymerase III subunit delta n=1 Tax=Alienimonas californiensis TaxID=2527989 RepID=A0A517P8A6_9PLAN|nr:DNA polymerase III subunit [Alienimonas californiensis]QDT15610.1 DNA polymerase III subunit delta' [Alienimonas californiensis]
MTDFAGDRSVWDAVRGHDAVVDGFRRAVGRGRLSSALLLAGPAGVGKRLFADTLAKCLLCLRTPDDLLEACGTCKACVSAAADTHPDLHRVRLPEGKREIPLAAFVGDKEDRGSSGLCYELSRRPALSERRVAIVEDADLVNPQAANAFLKTLEEPPAGAVLMLLSDRPESLLPTIRSRCQTVRFGPLPEADVAALLLDQGLAESPAEADQVARLSRGSLDAAARLADPEVRGLREVVRKHVGRGGPVAAAKAVVGAVEAAGSDAPSQRAAAAWVFAFCADLYRDRLAGLSEDFSSDVPGISDRLEHAAAALDRLSEAEAQIARNTSVPPVIEALVCDLNRG